MVLQMVAVFDSAAEFFGRPFFTPAVGYATRGFMDEVNRKDRNNELYQHPEDFTFYHLGSFDDSVGVFQIFEHPIVLVRGKDVVKSVSEE